MYRIGIDLGGTNIAAGIVDEKLNIIAKKSVPTLAGRGKDAIIDDIASLCRDICKEKGISFDEIYAIGVGVPGQTDSKRGFVWDTSNLPFSEVKLVDVLSEKLGFGNIKIDNDANAAALGEALAGSAKGSGSSVMITLGTGVGGGVILDGKILSGFNGVAGELGHMVIEVGGVPCNCGRRGCWEV